MRIFFSEKEWARKILEKFDFPKIERRQYSDIVGTLSQIKSDTRLGKTPSSESHKSLVSFLDPGSNADQVNYELILEPGKYENLDFLEDLTKFTESLTLLSKTESKVKNNNLLNTYFSGAKNQIINKEPFINDRESLNLYQINRCKIRHEIQRYVNERGTNMAAAQVFLDKFDEVFPEENQKLVALSYMQQNIEKPL